MDRHGIEVSAWLLALLITCVTIVVVVAIAVRHHPDSCRGGVKAVHVLDNQDGTNKALVVCNNGTIFKP